ncbi:response regulator [Chitinimonas koreensis]|uniref:response regulator n=1 Tax=Chitinimonas koreensis TaxID=356302 RepID=UPI00040F0CAD|nr:response regulator [Chitinimonas koreensis]QNM94803.1 response regulator [Chitinimonas koreensis]
MYHILVVDDEPGILNAVRRSLNGLTDEAGERVPLSVDCFSDPVAALQSAEVKAYDAVISDYRMPDMTGVEFLLFFRAKQKDAVRIILSGFADMEGMIGAINEAQIFRFVAKPWHEGELRHALLQGLETRRLLMENRRLADLVRAQQAKVSHHEALLARLEAESPGITQVRWGPNGEVLLDD